MGIFRYGEKRLTKSNGVGKEITVKRIGWRRIAKNTCRFGWLYVNPDSDSDEIIEPYSKKGKTRVELVFVRSDEFVASKPSVRVHEFFYNLIFLLRRIVAFLLPLLLLAGIVVSIIKREDGVKTAVIVCLTAFVLWIACIIVEGIIARCAASKLKSAAPKKQTKNVQDDDGIITLKSENGEDIDFVEIAGINYKGKQYAVLQPVETLDGMKDNEALVFRAFRGNDGEYKFEIELDEKIIDAVFAEYYKLLDEAESKGY